MCGYFEKNKNKIISKNPQQKYKKSQKAKIEHNYTHQVKIEAFEVDIGKWREPNRIFTHQTKKCKNTLKVANKTNEQICKQAKI